MITRLLCILLLVCLATICFSTSLRAHDRVEPRSMICFKQFPVNPSLFNAALKPYVAKIIAKHGLEEWKAVVLTHEVHHHMGFWSVLGAKMGVRARELLDAPLEEIRISSDAGSTPPISCMNDGLQVATGATLGRGTIKVSDAGRPIVVFTFKAKKLTMNVKPEIAAEIERAAKEVSDKYGFQSPPYFRALDKLAIECWLKWDRSKLFEEAIDANSQ